MWIPRSNVPEMKQGDTPDSKPIRWRGVYRAAKRGHRWAKDVLSGSGLIAYLLYKTYKPYESYMKELINKSNTFRDFFKDLKPFEGAYLPIPLYTFGIKRKRARYRKEHLTLP